MNICGISVTVERDQYEAASTALARIPGVEVSDGDYFIGLLVVVLSATDLTQEIEAFMAIHAVPGVLAAELLCQFTDFRPQPADCPLLQSAPPPRVAAPPVAHELE